MAAITGEKIHELAGRLVDAEWQVLLEQGKVTDAALDDGPVSDAGNGVTYKPGQE